jgi:hypothetical protein
VLPTRTNHGASWLCVSACDTCFPLGCAVKPSPWECPQLLMWLLAEQDQII